MNKPEYCNWTYTGECEYNKNKAVKSVKYETDCGKLVTWTRDNRINKLFQRYGQPFEQGKFNVRCPYCGALLNLYNPYDDGETWRM